MKLKYFNRVIFYVCILWTRFSYAQSGLVVTLVPSESHKYIESIINEGADNRVIDYSQAFKACVKDDCFYVVPSLENEEPRNERRPGCALDIIDNKYNAKKDADLKNNKESLENEDYSHFVWASEQGHAYNLLQAHPCKFTSIAFVYTKKMKRPLMLVSYDHLKYFNTFSFILYEYNGFKYDYPEEKYLSEFLSDSEANNMGEAKKELMKILRNK